MQVHKKCVTDPVESKQNVRDAEGWIGAMQGVLISQRDLSLLWRHIFTLYNFQCQLCKSFFLSPSLYLSEVLNGLICEVITRERNSAYLLVELNANIIGRILASGLKSRAGVGPIKHVIGQSFHSRLPESIDESFATKMSYDRKKIDKVSDPYVDFRFSWFNQESF